FSSRRRHTRSYGDWSSDVCSSDLDPLRVAPQERTKAEVLGHGQIGKDAAPFRRVAETARDQPVRLEAGDRGSVVADLAAARAQRSEERRVGKECGWRWAAEH